MRLLKKSSTDQVLMFLMIDSSDHITGKTGLTPTVTLSKNGSSFASPSGAVSEVGSGYYKVAGNTTDTNTAGPLILHATASGADPTDVEFVVVEFDPLNATSLGLSRLDQNVGTRLASADISLTSGAVTVGTINSGAITAASIATGAVDADALATDAVTEIAGGIWNATLTTYNSNGTFGGMLIRAKNGGTNDVEINGNNHISAVVHSMQADTLNASALATDAANEIADALLNRAINGGASTGRLVKDALKFLRNRFAVSSGTLTVYEADDTTPAWTSVVTSDAAADPIVESNPV